LRSAETWQQAGKEDRRYVERLEHG